jgi:DNA-binding MarR family transcriptional regulator/GNAT superfamily N-acetyltransferase
MDVEVIGQVRSFNRTVTQRIGVLEDEFLSRGRPLGQARVLWEIGHGGTDVRALRARLDLDSGYLSRLLRTLQSDGLVEVRQSGGDGRVRTAFLTAAGQAERAELDRRSDEAAAAILEPLSPRQRSALSAAMAEVERLLVATAVRIDTCDPGEPGARYCIAAYFDEISRRFEDGFDPGRSLPADAGDLLPPGGLLLVARLHGEPVGCGAVKFAAAGPAHIKRMWVTGSVRGLGVGRRILLELETRAAARGATEVWLETNRALGEAIGLYRSSGYQEVPAFNDEPYAHHWFAKRLDSRS